MKIEHQILLIKFVILMRSDNTVVIVTYSVMCGMFSHHPLKYLYKFTYSRHPQVHNKSNCFESRADDFCSSTSDENEKIPKVPGGLDKRQIGEFTNKLILSELLICRNYIIIKEFKINPG